MKRKKKLNKNWGKIIKFKSHFKEELFQNIQTMLKQLLVMVVFEILVNFVYYFCKTCNNLNKVLKSLYQVGNPNREIDSKP